MSHDKQWLDEPNIFNTIHWKCNNPLRVLSAGNNQSSSITISLSAWKSTICLVYLILGINGWYVWNRAGSSINYFPQLDLGSGKSSSIIIINLSYNCLSCLLVCLKSESVIETDMLLCYPIGNNQSETLKQSAPTCSFRYRCTLVIGDCLSIIAWNDNISIKHHF